MAGFGERLKRERELRRISLDDIAQATKIGTRFLRALEQQEFEKLPGGIFNKGFVRSYAKFLGIDEEQAVADYEAALHENLAARSSKALPVGGEGAEGEEARSARISSGGRPHRAGILVVLLAAVVCALAYFGWTRFSESSVPAEQSVAEEPVPVPSTAASGPSEVPPTAKEEAAQSSPTATPDAMLDVRPVLAAGAGAAPAQPAGSRSPQPGPPASEPPRPQEFEVRVQAVQDCWVSITADGRTVMTDTLPASSERTVRAQKEIALRVGNAGGVNVFFNGNALPALGEPNKTANVTFTPDGPRP